MEPKRLTLFAGHYGSGKTNIAVNYALHLAAEGKKVCIGDLDIVNPYFRTKDSAADLEAAGVELISPGSQIPMWTCLRYRRKYIGWCRSTGFTVSWTSAEMIGVPTHWVAMCPTF